MTSPGSPLPLSAIAFVAILPTNVAAAAGLPEAAHVVASQVAAIGEAWSFLHEWIGDSYGRAPALMLVLAVLIALPPLALAGFMLRSQRRSADTTVLVRSSARRAEVAGPQTVRTEVSAWPTEAWVEVPSEAGARYVVGRAMLRIGREADNDICLTERTVHRYHAVIRRTTEGDVLITDLSGAEGNGVLINGRRIGEGRLNRGDIIGIGEVKLKFDARPV